MGSEADRRRPLHLLFFPYLARSHMIPMLDTARVAAERGVKVSFVTTPANANLIRPTAEPHAMDIHLIPFPSSEFGIPDGCENLTDVPPSLGLQFVTALFHLQSSPHLEALLSSTSSVDALISDALYTSTTSLAAKHGVPRLIFQVTGLFPICAADALDLQRPYVDVADPSSTFTIPGFPESVRLTRPELPEVFDYPLMLRLIREAEMTSYGVVVNSFYDLEPHYADMYSKLGPRQVFLVGPTAIAGEPKPAAGDDRRRHPSLVWLDSKPDGSVVYLGFGTMSRFGEEQLRELALGLAASGCAFLWAVGGGGGERWLPEEFEKEVEGRGMVSREWVPQTEILNHRAVGGFVTHCGWNSVMEAVCAGVPMLTWPQHSEQFLIEKLLVHVLRVAAMAWPGGPKCVADEGKAVVPAAAVSAAVAGLMAAPASEEMRGRVKVLGEAGRRAIAEGGSSDGDMSRLIDSLLLARRRADHHAAAA